MSSNGDRRPDESVGSQLRRRREMSWRLPPLSNGRRDPVDPALPRLRPASVVIDNNRVVFLVRGHMVADSLRAFGLRPRWSAVERGYFLDLRHLADVCALLEHAGYVVRVRDRAEAA